MVKNANILTTENIASLYKVPVSDVIACLLYGGTLLLHSRPPSKGQL